jgi:hypothetical protein
MNRSNKRQDGDYHFIRSLGVCVGQDWIRNSQRIWDNHLCRHSDGFVATYQ